MAGVFPVQGFGFLSNYNGAFVASSAFAAMEAIASTCKLDRARAAALYADQDVE
ncbi:hypothetical protein [Bradyrhizobium sp. CCBAU 051011]|uniref:hypothetical protein n=1 Tax=Bradyrhizobium sp. CCBAU 051011 TaxID=858422 RepID=UPI001FEF69EA|nr:hypothetical protein [Bradyrhizobium sp. CCBAU 051011]